MLRFNDSYCVITSANISDDEKQFLTTLYQPIIGPIAVILYLFLVDENKLTRTIKINSTHLRWKNFFYLPLSQIEKERNKLEAIGLIDTYLKEDKEQKKYVYKLYSPLNPKNFFENKYLSHILLKTIGKTEYDRLCFYFAKDNFDLTQYKKISVAFNNLFLKNEPIIKYTNNVEITDNTHSKDLDYYCNFNLIKEKLLENNIDVEKILTVEVQLTIEQLASLYKLTINQLIKVIINSLDETKTKINLKSLATNCQIVIEQSNTQHNSIYHYSEQLLIEDNNYNSRLEQKIFEMKTLSPYDYLFLLKKIKPTKNEIDLLANLLSKYQLLPSVINCLLDYVWIKNNKNLVINYLEKIALTLQNENITTAEKAMKFFRNLYKINSSFKVKKSIIRPEVAENVITPKWWKEKKEDLTINKTETIDWDLLQEKLNQI